MSRGYSVLAFSDAGGAVMTVREKSTGSGMDIATDGYFPYNFAPKVRYRPQPHLLPDRSHSLYSNLAPICITKCW
ncbi:hypothetical protein BDZ91DRAFT_266512 [Kalaharituber pfeilii]|nr:hypothetical protein BDZ91DRAFT_266512 [Kalaharituber pfeilii]